MDEENAPQGDWPRVAAVIFDLDGVLVDSEPWWTASRAAVARDHGAEWTAADEASVKGANTAEWSAAMRERLPSPIPEEELAHEVVELMVVRYAQKGVSRIEPGLEAVERLRRSVPLAVASSAHPTVIDAALRSLGLERAFRAIVSSDEVAAGKPAPDVYLEAARRLGVEPEACLVIEDSPSGVRAARSARMRVIWVGDAAVENGRGRPDDDGGRAIIRLATLDELSEALVLGADRAP